MTSRRSLRRSSMPSHASRVVDPKWTKTSPCLSEIVWTPRMPWPPPRMPSAGTSGSRAPADHATRRAAEGVARSSASSVAPAHHSAKSLEEAAARLVEAAGSARAVAGGTDLVGILKDRVHNGSPETLVDLKTIPGLAAIEERDGALAIGSLARLSELERHPVVRERHRALAQAAQAIASPQLRNMGTVGGNIAQEPRCWYYRSPDDAFDCMRKGGRYCNALTGDSRHHSIAGSMKVETRPCTNACPEGWNPGVHGAHACGRPGRSRAPATRA